MGTVSDILGAKGHEVLRIDGAATVLDAVKAMVGGNVGALIMTEGGEISGIVTGVVLVLAAASSLSGFQRRRRRPRRVQLSARTAAVRVSK